jgi:hypothetical protein
MIIVLACVATTQDVLEEGQDKRRVYDVCIVPVHLKDSWSCVHDKVISKSLSIVIAESLKLPFPAVVNILNKLATGSLYHSR